MVMSTDFLNKTSNEDIANVMGPFILIKDGKNGQTCTVFTSMLLEKLLCIHRN